MSNQLTLKKEIKNYSNITKQYELTLTKLAQFFQALSLNGKMFLSKSEKALEEFYNELQKEDKTTTYNICFRNFYERVKEYFSKLNSNLLEIDKQLEGKLLNFITVYKTNNNGAIKQLEKILTKIEEQKIILEKSKISYFDASKEAMGQEIKIIELKNNENTSREDYKKNNDILEKLVSLSNEKEKKYKVEIENMNKLLDSNENDYKSIIEVLVGFQNNKIQHLYDILDNFKNIITNFNKSDKELITDIEKIKRSSNIKRDVNIFKDDHNYLNDKDKRFTNEEFFDYEIYKKNTEKKGMDIRQKTLAPSRSTANFRERKKIYIHTFEKSSKIVWLGKKQINMENLHIKNVNNQLNELINEIIQSDTKLEDKNFNFLLTNLENNANNSYIFIHLLANHYNNNGFIKVNNLDNLNLLSNLLSIVLQFGYNDKSIFEVCYMVIFIAEKTIYYDPNDFSNKYYLCKNLSKQSQFSLKDFWRELIMNKILMVTEVKIKLEMEKRCRPESTRLNTISNIEINNDNNMFKKFKGYLRLDFGAQKSKENKNIEDEIISGRIRKEKLPSYCMEVIDEYIQHFNNFNFEGKNPIELIKEIHMQYKFNEVVLNSFLAQIKSNSCVNKFLKSKIIDVPENIDYKVFYFKNIHTYTKKMDDKTQIILTNTLKYLDLKDFPNILLLKKNYNKTFLKIIYDNLLLKKGDIDCKNHLRFWKVLLDYRTIIKKYDYKKIKEEINNSETPINGSDVIDLDTVRTTFDSDKEINQKKISNILKSIIYSFKNVNYCQGMNYIAAFFLNITEYDEEEAFYLFSCLISSTEYGELFKDDLAKLKKIFYIFERILSILLPELFYYFKENNIGVSYFISSWNITLFTNTFQYNNNKKNPMVLFRILELFFLNGWESIIKLGIFVLKNYEAKLMTLTFEDLLHFLINDIVKSDFFQNENFENVMNITLNFKIEDSLIENLDKEFEIKKSSPNVGKRESFQII